MHLRPFQQVDVFTATAYRGNPLAVVLDGAGLSDAQMQRFARWTNLSETTFVLPPTPEAKAAGADYQVRIFAATYEMPFAGHPTLGTCHAWLNAGGIAQQPDYVVQQCKAGLVKIRRSAKVTDAGVGTDAASSYRLAFAAPPVTTTPANPALLGQIANALGIKADQMINGQFHRNGSHHFALLLDQHHTVLGLQPNMLALGEIMVAIGVTGIGVAAVEIETDHVQLIARSNREARAFSGATTAPVLTATPSVQVRFFHLGQTVVEDPVTGTFNASLAQWLIGAGHTPAQYLAAQGSAIGCEGRIYLEQDATGQVWVGGDVVNCVQGQVLL